LAFDNTQTVTIGTSEISLDRILTGTTTGHFMSLDGQTELEITPSTSKAGRRHTVARLRQKKTTADPLVGSTNVRVNDFVSINVNRPLDGYTDDEVIDQIDALVAWLAVTSGGATNAARLVAGQN